MKMLQEIPAHIEWLKPWERLQGSGEAFVNELQTELPYDHALHGVAVVAVARRIDCDDVLFATADPAKPLAVVHLTWAGRTEGDARWPTTTLFHDWQDWVERRLLPDHREYSGDG
jgi:hypothetical protein